MWISQTVLRRLVAEIAATNKQLAKLGMTDVAVGQTSLEKLKKVAGMPQIVTSAPSLHFLLPFLEVTPHQEYLVDRIRVLSRGGAMSDFKWNGGGRFLGRDWSDKLPTDCDLVIHAFACYFDSRIPPVKGVIDGKVFSSLFFFGVSEKPESAKVRVPCAILQTAAKPPHFMLQVGEEKWDLSPGRNNLFHTLLCFLHYMKVKQNGMIGRVNMGLSGINILWVLDE